MKNKFIQLFSKPKQIIPLASILIISLGVWAYLHIGRAPAIPSTIDKTTTDQVISAGSNISMSFAQSGKVEAVLVASGDHIQKGQVLARLSSPQAQGAVAQAKGALSLAQAQFASLNSQYKTASSQQDTLVKNAYATLLSAGLEGVGDAQDPNVPIISGTYTCGKEGTYILKPYSSGDTDSGYSVRFSGIETGTFGVKYDNGVPMGSCGLQVKFAHVKSFNPFITWTIAIPNTKSSSYLANKNAYDLAVENRDKVLTDLATTIGTDGGSSVAKAQIDAAEGAYQAALGAYQNNLIIAPTDGVITFVDTDLKVGQSVPVNKSLISMTAK